jgi:hypothetical protein
MHLGGCYALSGQYAAAGVFSSWGSFQAVANPNWTTPIVWQDGIERVLDNATRPLLGELTNEDAALESVPPIPHYINYTIMKGLIKWHTPAKTVAYNYLALGEQIKDAATIFALYADDILSGTRTSRNRNKGFTTNEFTSTEEIYSALVVDISDIFMEYGPAEITLRDETPVVGDHPFDFYHLGQRVLDSSLILCPTYKTSLTKEIIDLKELVDGVLPHEGLQPYSGAAAVGVPEDVYVTGNDTDKYLKVLSSIVPYGTAIAGVGISFPGITWGVVEEGTRRFEIMPIKISTESSRNWYGTMILGNNVTDRPYYATTEDVEQPRYGGMYGKNVQLGIALRSIGEASNSSNNFFESVTVGTVSNRAAPFGRTITRNPDQQRMLDKMGKVPPQGNGL